MNVPLAIGALVVATAVVAVVVAIGAWRQAKRSAEQAKALMARTSSARASQTQPPRRHDSSSRWAAAVLLAAAADIAAAAVLGFSASKTSGYSAAPRHLTRSAAPAPRRASPGASGAEVPGQLPTAHPPTGQARQRPPHRSERAEAPTPTLPPVLAGAGPVLVAISPASAAPGQVVTLSGYGFFSPDGLISVTFGGLPAPVHCPSRDVCKATVPAGKPGASVPVTISTQSGSSNQLSFVYS
jgi:hypothetical protein